MILGAPPAPPKDEAAGLIRAVRGLGDDRLRTMWLVDLLLRVSSARLAPALDAWCARAEQADEAAREALIALVDALATPDPPLVAAVQRLREEAAGEGHTALDRLLRAPPSRPTSVTTSGDPNAAKVPDYGRGRPLTLGERKTLARRPDRAAMERLLADPHPDVIRFLLANPRLTEDDVLRLATRRPARGDVLAEIARAPRWVHRPRVRRALILNPDTPQEIAASVAGLLLRQELRYVVSATTTPAAIRALCREHLERRPPMPTDAPGDDEILQ